MRLRPGESELALFLLWSHARSQERRIVDDLAARFTIREMAEVAWSGDGRFAANLNRFYGDVLPPDSDKERHCGSGPFLTVVVEDGRPRYRVRRTNRGPRYVNANVFDARRRYREWTGGGHRVHASDGPAEFDRNVTLLFGRRASQYRVLPTSASLQQRSDPVGAGGWTSMTELLLVLDAWDGRVLEPDGAALTVDAPNPWWTGVLVGGQEVEPGVREVLVGDRTIRIRFRQGPRARARGPAALVASRPAQSAYRFLERAKRFDIAYRRRSATLAITGVAGVSVALAQRLLPAGLRPGIPTAVTVTVPGTYLALRVVDQSGRGKQFKHTVLDSLGGDVDDAQTWIVGVLAAVGLSIVAGAAQRRAGAVVRGLLDRRS